MKKIAVLFVFFMSALAAFAGTDSTAVTLAPQPKKHKIYEMNVPKDRIYLDLLGTNWIHKGDNGFQTRWYSRGINFGVMYDLQIRKSRVSFAVGLGMSWVNIYNNSQLLDSTGSGVTFKPLPHYYDTVKINKVVTTWIDLPLELRIRSNRDRLNQCWKVAIGFKFGIRVNAYTKTVTENPKLSIKENPYPDFNLFRMGPTLRIGYSSFNITGYYGVLGVFKGGRGPAANEFAVGISFNGL